MEYSIKNQDSSGDSNILLDPFTKEEDEKIRILILKNGKSPSLDWDIIVSELQLNRRSREEIIERWDFVLKNHPKINGRWIKEEDHLLTSLMSVEGSKKRWVEIAKLFPGRIGKQCRERWVNQLNPDIDRSPFSIRELKRILEIQAIDGNKWARIASFLPGRTDNQVKNVWNSKLSKRPRSYWEKRFKEEEEKNEEEDDANDNKKSTKPIKKRILRRSDEKNSKKKHPPRTRKMAPSCTKTNFRALGKRRRVPYSYDYGAEVSQYPLTKGHPPQMIPHPHQVYPMGAPIGYPMPQMNHPNALNPINNPNTMHHMGNHQNVDLSLMSFDLYDNHPVRTYEGTNAFQPFKKKRKFLESPPSKEEVPEKKPEEIIKKNEEEMKKGGFKFSIVKNMKK